MYSPRNNWSFIHEYEQWKWNNLALSESIAIVSWVGLAGIYGSEYMNDGGFMIKIYEIMDDKW